MSFAITLPDHPNKISYEFGCMAEANGWFMEISIDGRFAFIFQQNEAKNAYEIDLVNNVQIKNRMEKIDFKLLNDLLASLETVYNDHLDDNPFNEKLGPPHKIGN